MAWSETQRHRLVRERQILAEYFPALKWVNPTSPTGARIEGEMVTNSGRSYGVRLYLPQTYPDACPDMVVIDPCPLRDAKGRAMTVSSLDMHVLGERDGFTKVCHYRSSRWVPANTLYKVALKGRIWLEAYEAHLRTGSPIDRFLRHMTEYGTAPGTAPPDPEENVFVGLIRRLLG